MQLPEEIYTFRIRVHGGERATRITPESRMSAPVRFRGFSVRPGWDPGPRIDYPKSC